jgi:hypothetical protein
MICFSDPPKDVINALLEEYQTLGEILFQIEIKREHTIAKMIRQCETMLVSKTGVSVVYDIVRDFLKDNVCVTYSDLFKEFIRKQE